MSVRLFVTSAALMIFSWLAATYLRAVPMETYPDAPQISARPAAPPAFVAAAVEGESDGVSFITTGGAK